jgi:large subunit ribosomal protein L17
MTGESVERLFDKVAPRFGDRQGGYLRIVHTGWRQGDGGQKVFIELLGAEKVLDEKREKRAEARAKRIETAKAEMEAQGEAAPETPEEKK